MCHVREMQLHVPRTGHEQIVGEIRVMTKTEEKRKSGKWEKSFLRKIYNKRIKLSSEKVPKDIERVNLNW